MKKTDIIMYNNFRLEKVIGPSVMDFTLPVMKFNAEQTPENSGPRYRPMRRKRIEPKSQEQTPQNIKNERRRLRKFWPLRLR